MPALVNSRHFREGPHADILFDVEETKKWQVGNTCQ